MTTKKDRLLRVLAELTVSHSPDDWLYVAEQLDTIAEVARRLSRQSAVKRKVPGKKTTIRKSALPNEGVIEPMSESVAQFSELVRSLPSRPSVADLRHLALGLGIKDELRGSASDMLLRIYRHLNGLNEVTQAERIQRAVAILEARLPDQSDHYARWFSLITKQPPTT